MADVALTTMWSDLVSKIASDPRVTPHLKGHLDLAVPKGVLDDTLFRGPQRDNQVDAPAKTQRIAS